MWYCTRPNEECRFHFPKVERPEVTLSYDRRKTRKGNDKGDGSALEDPWVLILLIIILISLRVLYLVEFLSITNFAFKNFGMDYRVRIHMKNNHQSQRLMSGLTTMMKYWPFTGELIRTGKWLLMPGVASDIRQPVFLWILLCAVWRDQVYDQARTGFGGDEKGTVDSC